MSHRASTASQRRRRRQRDGVPRNGARRAASIGARARGRRAREMPFGSDEFRAKATEDDKDFDAATVETVRKQMEFYFCDLNLPRDAFLLEEVARAKRDGFDGAIDIALIAGFSRMRDIWRRTVVRTTPGMWNASPRLLELSELWRWCKKRESSVSP